MPDLLDGLNANQRAAVTHPGGPLRVVAGAGTGKTRTLTRRFAWLVEQGTPADAILALTFSTPAAAEMRERLETLLDTPYEELNVSTFHAFCLKLLRDEALEACVDPFLTPVTPADRLALLLERINDLSLRHHEIRGNPAPLLASFVSRIDRLKDELISADELRAWADALPEGTDAERAHTCREREFARLYADHDRMLAERGALDFGDLIVHAFKLLHERPHVRERTARRFRHVLVDEYQDTNFAQGMLLRLLVEDHANVTVAGDDDQAIYRFRGASQKNLLEFERELPDVTTIKLERNFRSGAADPHRRHRGGRTDRGAHSEEAHGCQRRAGALLALHLRARAGAGRGSRGRATDRRAASPRRRSACWCARSRPRARWSPRRWRSARSPSARSAPPRTSSAPRCATCWPGCARWRIRPTPAPWCARSVRPPIELRSVDVARLTQLARRRKLDMPSAVAAALEGPQLSPEGRDRARAFLRLYRSASTAFEDRRPDAFVHAPDRAHRPAPPAGVRHPRRHDRAAAQHRQAARAGHRLHAPRAAGHRARVRALHRRRRRVRAARGGGRRAAVRAGRPGHDDARGQGPRVRPRLRARPVGRRHAGPVPRAQRTTCPTSCSRSASRPSRRARCTRRRCAACCTWP